MICQSPTSPGKATQLKLQTPNWLEMCTRYFPTTTSFIDQAVKSGGLIVVNCVMGWSRSASVVAAYLVMKHKMKATKVNVQG